MFLRIVVFLTYSVWDGYGLLCSYLVRSHDRTPFISGALHTREPNGKRTMKMKSNEMKNDWCCRNSQVFSTRSYCVINVRMHLLLFILHVIIDTSSVCCTAFTLNSNHKFVELNGRTSGYFVINKQGGVPSLKGRPNLTRRMSTLMDPISSSSSPSKFPHGRRQSKPSSFAQRMRSIIQKDTSHTNPSLPTSDILSAHAINVKVVHTLEEFRALLQENKDKIIVVRWFAPWCRACKAIEPLFYKLSSSYNEKHDVLFLEVPVTEKNSDLHQGLAVPSLPFGHIYHPTAGLVEEMKLLKPNFRQFEKTLQWYIFGSCDLPDGEGSSPFTMKP